MTAEPSTLADLRKAGVIGSRDIVAAIDAFMREPTVGHYRFASGHCIDIAAIVDATPSLDRVERASPKEKTFRTALAAAVMAARPIKP